MMNDHQHLRPGLSAHISTRVGAALTEGISLERANEVLKPLTQDLSQEKAVDSHPAGPRVVNRAVISKRRASSKQARRSRTQSSMTRRGKR